MSSRLWKRPASANDQLNLSQLSGLDDETLELHHSSIHEEKLSPSSKRCRLGQDDECNSHSRTANQVFISFLL